MLFSKECECIVDWIDELYAIEREAKDLDHLLELRQKHSVKIVFGNRRLDYISSRSLS